MKQTLLEKLRKEYPVGARIELIKMDDVQAPPIGTKGTVKGVDDVGSILVNWDNGSGLNVAYLEDEVETLITCPMCQNEMRVSKKNNPAPFKEEFCCDDCNDELVIPLRLFLTGKLTNKVLVIEPNGMIRYERVLGKELKLETAQRYVEGFVEFYPMRDRNLHFIVNEEGLYKDLEYNYPAKELFNIDIVGNLLICPKKLIS